MQYQGDSKEKFASLTSKSECWYHPPGRYWSIENLPRLRHLRSSGATKRFVNKRANRLILEPVLEQVYEIKFVFIEVDFRPGFRGLPWKINYYY
jgi:hypothetical protein